MSPDRVNQKAAATLGKNDTHPIEVHPFEPFLPANARLLMLGTFPPSPKRWCMPWYYPNFQNDMWRIFGLCFFGDKNHFVLPDERKFDLPAIQLFLKEKGVAIFDTALRIRRTTGSASDKDLEIVTQADIDGMLTALPQCKAVLAAGQLATSVLKKHFNITGNQRMGSHVEFAFQGRQLSLYREPSSSRAYPMRLESKAEYYRQMFSDLGML